MCLGIPGKVIEITDESTLMAKVDVCGVVRPVNIACIVSGDYPANQCVGNWVLVHVGFAMSRIDEDEAQKTLEILAELGEVQEELEAMRQSATTA